MLNLLIILIEKKPDIQTAKTDNFIIYFIENEPSFLQAKEDPAIPKLKLSYKYPMILPNTQGGQGGIKNLIFGVDIIIQGITSLGGKLPIEKEIPRNLVFVLCEGR